MIIRIRFWDYQIIILHVKSWPSYPQSLAINYHWTDSSYQTSGTARKIVNRNFSESQILPKKICKVSAKTKSNFLTLASAPELWFPDWFLAQMVIDLIQQLDYSLWTLCPSQTLRDSIQAFFWSVLDHAFITTHERSRNKTFKKHKNKE